MQKLLKSRKLAIMIFFLSSLFIFSFSAIGGEDSTGSATASSNARTDLIIIDSMSVLGNLERPAVPFLHDQHTQALEKQKKDCKTCHLAKDEKQSVKFMRFEDSDRQTVMDIYHNNCIKCHQEMIGTGEKAGPIVCAECHQEKPDSISSRQPMEMDKSLHYRHAKAYDNKCETCHHEYDEVEKKLFYAKGKEGSCRYCHEEKTEENRISMRLASHIGCLDCHMKKISEKKESGPVQCSGCHDAEKQKKIKQIADVPRMDRKQPDTVFLKTGKDSLDTRMNYVPFDHKAHEKSNDTCRVCHHAEMDACVKCHTLDGSKDGDNIKLEMAMHDITSKHSCTGCHEMKKRDENCAGCHAAFPKEQQQDDAYCQTCHMKLLPGMNVSEKSDVKDEMAAGKLLSSRKPVIKTYPLKDIPEKISIKEMSDKYEPVDFPHRKIVQTIFENIQDDKIAGYFHTETGTLCQGCHHNSPAALKPPRCGHCHGKSFDEKDLFKPGIVGAYHIQCMECHSNMKIDKNGCTDCHKEKSK